MTRYRAQKGTKKASFGFLFGFWQFGAPNLTNTTTANTCMPNWVPYQPSDTLGTFTFCKKFTQNPFWCAKLPVCVPTLPTNEFLGGYRNPSRQARSDTKLETCINYQMSNCKNPESHWFCLICTD